MRLKGLVICFLVIWRKGANNYLAQMFHVWLVSEIEVNFTKIADQINLRKIN